MATCFRIPNRFCCSSIYKPTYILHAEKSTLSSRKPVQKLSSKAEVNALNVGQIYRISASSQLYNFNNTVAKNTNCMPYFPIVPCSAVTEYRQNLNLNSSVHLISQNEYRLMASSSPDNTKAEDQSSSLERPSDEQLEAVFQHLSKFLPSLFSSAMEADKYYYKNIVLENRIRGTRTVGIGKYVSQLALLKIVAHLKFACVRFHVLKITKHPEDGTIKCRWRIAGVNGMSVIFQFWKYTPLNLRDKIQTAPTWYDGFSTYFVGSDGLIHKHVIDKMMPDDDKVTVDKSFTSKVALCLGLLPSGQREILASMVESSADHSSYLSQVMLPLEKIS